ncbi:MAG: sulfatase-like hydrolase/transferase [Akkermansiaceae bacterium]|nr:sulfatase-like hydrolase/transferase [Akkermansiaceae bacterium]NNM31023.1 sulfatase-like hydrolase/transferase [Akkermansiaceae bacterium]
MLLAATVTGWSQQPPNVVLIVVDDLTVRLPTHGYVDGRTPNLLRLAARGVNFRRAYAQYPYCGPSRASMITGLYPWRIGISATSWTSIPEDILPSHLMLPQYFGQHGYRTVRIGKIEHPYSGENSWHTSIAKSAKPDDHGPPIDNISYPNPRNTAATIVRTWDLPDEEFGDGQVARDAVRELGNLAATGSPFFVGIGLSAHTPWKLPRDLWLTFDPDDITLPVEPPESYESWWNLLYRHDPGLPLPDEANRRGALAGYDAAIHFMDRNLGTILDALDENELWDNTVVVFTSDHGIALGEHLYWWSKGIITNEVLQIPLIIAAPGYTQGQECWSTAQLVDIYKTLVDVCGLPEWNGRISLDGRSLKAGLVDPLALPEAPGFSVTVSQQWKQPSPRRPNARVVHYDGWKLVERGIHTTGEIKDRFMFNHNVDPEEYFVIGDPGKAEELLAHFPPESAVHLKSYIGFDRLTVQPDGSVILGTDAELPIDRDGDGMSDEIELSLAALGLDYLTPQPDLAYLLSPFVSDIEEVPVVLPAGPRLRIRVLESTDLRNWYPTTREAHNMGFGEIHLPPRLVPPDAAFFRAEVDVVVGGGE